MTQSPEKIRSWLDAHRDEELRIWKLEDGQENRARIHLEDVQLVQHHDTDDYLSDQALLLKGRGTVETPAGEALLPGQTFEISLTDQWFSAADEHSLQLSTERGSYRIERVERWLTSLFSSGLQRTHPACAAP